MQLIFRPGPYWAASPVLSNFCPSRPGLPWPGRGREGRAVRVGDSLSGSRTALVWLMGFHPLGLQFCSHAQNHILVDLWKLFKVKQALLVETVQG